MKASVYGEFIAQTQSQIAISVKSLIVNKKKTKRDVWQFNKIGQMGTPIKQNT